MKAVLISIQPKWCELIASGKKTVEVRKTKPKLETPFKVYIYCTNEKGRAFFTKGENGNYNPARIGNGKVIGEFVCDKITPLFNVATTSWSLLAGNVHEYAKSLVRMARLTEEEMHSYAKRKNCYAWHISDLVIYDKPRELGEFRRYPRTEHCGFGKCELCRHGDYNQLDDEWFCRNYIARAPQSWCYVEE